MNFMLNEKIYKRTDGKEEPGRGQHKNGICSFLKVTHADAIIVLFLRTLGHIVEVE